MTQRGTGLGSLRIPAGEQGAKEVRSAAPEEESSVPGGKASTASPEDVEGYAPDTINDGDGNHLEPPD
jgi:hypothetical protein